MDSLRERPSPISPKLVESPKTTTANPTNAAVRRRPKSGKPSTQGKKATGERYLPKKAREALSDKEYAATSRKKREDTKKGKQFSKQPKKIAKKTAKHRKG